MSISSALRNLIFLLTFKMIVFCTFQTGKYKTLINNTSQNKHLNKINVVVIKANIGTTSGQSGCVCRTNDVRHLTINTN